MQNIWDDDESDVVNLLSLRSQFSGSLEKDKGFFENTFRPLYDKGNLLYHRRILSPIDRHVKVWDDILQKPIEMIMMGSNSYLGFANDPEIKEKVKESIDKYGVGMGGPMLLNGTSELHRTLELRIAKFKGKEDSILLPSGYMTSLTWITTLVEDDAILLYDEYSHASIADGIRLGKRKAFRFEHNNTSDLEIQLKKHREKNSERDIWVTTQGVYSMNGELAPAKEIADLCEKYNAYYIIDDAHGTGVLGKGRGTAEEFEITKKLKYTMGTFSKAFSVTGGFISGDKESINLLRFFARPYFFTAAPSPMVMAAIHGGLDILERDTSRVDALHSNIKYFYNSLDKAGIKYTKTGSAIVPVFPSSVKDFRAISRSLHENGLFVNPIEPPGVPKGGERFRVSLMATLTKSDIDQATDILKNVFSRFSC